jgi:hypothetical protein
MSGRVIEHVWIGMGPGARDYRNLLRTSLGKPMWVF